MKNFLNEFKSFAMKGNVVDLAVGVIIGAAFGKIVSALVDNILMPILGILVGSKNFDYLVLRVGNAEIGYGAFISAAINFVIVALALFLLIKGINRLSRLQKQEEAAMPAPTPEDIQLLREIRDSLKK